MTPEEFARSRDWIHERERALAKRGELLVLIRDQLRVAFAGVPPPCAGCGSVRKWEQLYRCWHCGLWLCVRCARKHFGARP
jgi:hypothetical protein